MKKILILTAFLFTLAFIVYPENYTPKVGDEVILITHKFSKKDFAAARNFFTTTFLANLKNDKIIRDTLFLENMEQDELVIISFASSGEANFDFSNDDFYNKEIKSKTVQLTTSVTFKLLTVNDESFDPKKGDYVMIWNYNVKENSLTDAANHFQNKIYPLLAKDKYSRDSYLIAFKAFNIMVGITMYKGEYKDSDEVKAKLSELNNFLDKPAKSKTYKIIGLNNE